MANGLGYVYKSNAWRYRRGAVRDARPVVTPAPAPPPAAPAAADAVAGLLVALLATAVTLHRATCGACEHGALHGGVVTRPEHASRDGAWPDSYTLVDADGRPVGKVPMPWALCRDLAAQRPGWTVRRWVSR